MSTLLNQFSKTNNINGISITNNIFRDKRAGLVFSPISFNSATSLAFLGTVGRTKDQISNALGFSADKFIMVNDMESIMSDLKNNITMMNTFFVKKDFSISKDYLKTVRNLGSIVSVDFGHPKVTDYINSYISKKTAGKITNLLGEGTVNTDTRVAIINTVYIKSQWLHPFKKSSTRVGPFITLKGEEKPAEMMQQSENFNYYEDPRVQVLEMFYRGSEFSMVIVLPKRRFIITTIDELNSYVLNTVKKRVDVRIPKFTQRNNLDLVPIMKKMGVTDLFDPHKCDLSEIDPDRDLYVDSVIQESFIEVNEEGTEATSATAMTMTRNGMPSRPDITFNANRTFSYYIRHSPTNTVMFSGVYDG